VEAFLFEAGVGGAVVIEVSPKYWLNNRRNDQRSNDNIHIRSKCENTSHKRKFILRAVPENGIDHQSTAVIDQSWCALRTGHWRSSSEFSTIAASIAIPAIRTRFFRLKSADGAQAQS
jgi:hypothetical protein